MSRILFGVMGHVDHGKTALVRALTGMETDRLPEEKRRGVSIALGFAYARIGEVEIDFVDMPGHERFVRTLVSGATGMQAALLVVAAGEGIKPQTREHVDIAALLGVTRMVAVVSKTDLVDAETVAATSAEVAALLARAGLEGGAPIPVSVVTGEGLHALRDALAAEAARAAPAQDDGYPFLPVDRAFTLSGHGTVVTGTLRRGRLARGEVLEIAPSGLAVRVRGLQVHGAAVDAASPGQRVAVNLRGAELDQVPRGVALSPMGRVAAGPWLTVELSVPADAPALRTGARLRLLIGTADVACRLRLLDRDGLEPGTTALAQLDVSGPVAAPARERFILRLASPAGTVAGGRVLDPQAGRLKRSDAVTLARLARMACASPEEVVGLGVEAAGASGVALERLAGLSGLAPARVEAALSTLAVARTADGAVQRDAWESVLARTEAALRGARGEALAIARLRSAVPEAGPVVLDAALAALAKAGRVRMEGGSVRLVDAQRERGRAETEAQAAARLAESLRAGGLSPPDLPAEPHARRAVDRLVREGLAVRTYDRVQKREVVFHHAAVEAARRTLAPRLTEPGMTVGEAGALLGITRKFSVPLLEHLDAVQFTRRVGDRRTLGPGARA